MENVLMEIVSLKDVYEHRKHAILKALITALEDLPRCDLEKQEELYVEPMLDLIDFVAWGLTEHYMDYNYFGEFKRRIVAGIVANASFDFPAPRRCEDTLDEIRAERKAAKSKRKAAA
jgi:hypothetical protein